MFFSSSSHRSGVNLTKKFCLGFYVMSRSAKSHHCHPTLIVVPRKTKFWYFNPLPPHCWWWLETRLFAQILTFHLIPYKPHPRDWRFHKGFFCVDLDISFNSWQKNYCPSPHGGGDWKYVFLYRS